MEIYDEQLSVKAAVGQLFQRFNFPADAYTTQWFVIPIGKFPVHLPNLPSRVKVARLHDIHHVLTGYPANWRGEAEIGAWEIATGCRTYWIAWFFNIGATLVGAFLWPRAVWKAFKRGWRTRTNLYYDYDYDALLKMKVSELRAEIGLDH